MSREVRFFDSLPNSIGGMEDTLVLETSAVKSIGVRVLYRVPGNRGGRPILFAKEIDESLDGSNPSVSASPNGATGRHSNLKSCKVSVRIRVWVQIWSR